MVLVGTKLQQTYRGPDVATSSPIISYFVTVLLTKYYSNMTMTRSGSGRKAQSVEQRQSK